MNRRAMQMAAEGASDGEAGPPRLGVEQMDAQRSRSIQRLPEDVVNKIAAGEIIQRPANALKEMMENSLDAGAKMIRIQLRDGGIKMLQIQDDGDGVARQDLPLLCERFATSKLRAFEDLSNMTTFGFRGEALASISYVSAAMTVTSKTRDSEVAYRASYASGVLTPPKPGQSAEPRPCAGSQGTMITAEDLFYNVPQRRRALKSASDEYALALDVVSKYAVHYGGRGVGFSCKKASANLMDISTPSSSRTTTREAIGVVYGNTVAKSLQEVKSHRDETLKASIDGFVSGANYSAKKANFLLFINDRLVESPALRRAVLSVYTTLLPKGSHPWIYLSLSIDPANVDVNVHPTKREVHFLNEDEIIDLVCVRVEAALADANASRSFSTTQSILPPSMRMPVGETTDHERKRSRIDDEQTDEGTSSPTIEDRRRSLATSQRAGYPQHLVRVDGKMRTLDVMGITSSRSSSSLVPEASNVDTHTELTDSSMQDQSFATSEAEDTGEGVQDTTKQALNVRITQIAKSQTSLLSINLLREAVQRQEHFETKEIVRDHVFVGIADASKTLSLLQHGTKLFLVQYSAVIEEVAYQLLLRQFGALQATRLVPAPYIVDLVRLALSVEGMASKEKRQHLELADDVVCKKVENKLMSFAEMLEEYFAIGLERDADGRARLASLPDVMPSRTAARSSPLDSQDDRSFSHSSKQTTASASSALLQLDRVPALVLRLATQVDYGDETACFEAVLRELARAHAPPVRGRLRPTLKDDSDPTPLSTADDTYDHGDAAVAKQHEHDWRSAWASTMRYYSPSKHLARSGVVKAVASLPSLYSVFERC